MASVLDGEGRAALEARLLYLAWRWYRIPSDVAEDIVQSAMLTYLEVAHRYPRQEEHRVIVVGIFRNKCREHITRSVRNVKGLNGLRAAAESGGGDIPVLTTAASAEDGVLHDLVHSEDGRLILEAFRALRPPAREMFRLIVEEGYTRQQLIEHYRVNKNTLDSRLHAYRGELREILSQRGIEV